MARPVSRAARTVPPAVVLAVALGLSACSHDHQPAQQPPREQAGPTLATGPVPAGWKDVHDASGLVYSVPPEWETAADGRPDPLGGKSGGAEDEGTDWGSGYVTHANAVADRGYCSGSDFSFRVLSGLTGEISGKASDQAVSAAHSLTDSVRTRFTRHGADVPAAEPVRIGVSNTPAYHVTVRGQVHEPRDVCTPPVIRVDAIAVRTTGGDGAESTVLFVLMADEEQQGVVPTSTVDQVLASLRFDNSL